MLRITVSTCEEKVVLKLEGRLEGPSVDELRKTVLLTDTCFQPLEIDATGLTDAENDHEQPLVWLHRTRASFQGKGPFPEYLLDRLQIPLSEQMTAQKPRKESDESRKTRVLPKGTGAKRKRQS